MGEDEAFGWSQRERLWCLEKHSAVKQYITVPETDTGGYVEKTKAYERTHV